MFVKAFFLLSLLLASVQQLEAASACAPSCFGASVGEKVRVPWDCTKYSVCADIHGIGELWASEPTSCPDGQYFNPLHVPPQCAPINGAIDGFCQNTCSPCDPLWSFLGDTTPNPDDCNTYFACLASDQLLKVTCEDESMPYYDYVHGGCSSDETVCYNFCDKCEPYCLAEGNIADPMDCTAFYYCMPPEMTHVQCPVGENFNADTEHCSTVAPCVQC